MVMASMIDIHFIYWDRTPTMCSTKRGNTEDDVMIATALVYTVLAFTGLVGSAIAWGDLRKGIRKSTAKQS